MTYTEEEVRRIVMEAMQRTVQACLNEMLFGAKPWQVDTQEILETLLNPKNETHIQ